MYCIQSCKLERTYIDHFCVSNALLLLFLPTIPYTIVHCFILCASDKYILSAHTNFYIQTKSNTIHILVFWTFKRRFSIFSPVPRFFSNPNKSHSFFKFFASRDWSWPSPNHCSDEWRVFQTSRGSSRPLGRIIKTLNSSAACFVYFPGGNFWLIDRNMAWKISFCS